MTSLKDIFPLRGMHKPQKNFIKENIKRVKGCNHCDRKKETPTIGVMQSQQNQKISNITYRISEQQPTIKCNVKIVSQGKAGIFQNIQNNERLSSTKNCCKGSRSNSIKSYRNQECQTDMANNSSIGMGNEDTSELRSSCTACGHVIHRKNASLQVEIPTSTNDNDGSILPNTFNQNISDTVSFYDGKKINHDSAQQQSMKTDHKEEILKENMFKRAEGILKPSSNYKLGVVPRYLKERNSRWEQEKKITQEKEKMEELLGIKDPDCPPGHMLMLESERVRGLNQLQKEFDEEIRKLNTIPVSSDTYRVRQKKIEIEKKLNRIEEAMNALKRVKVFVKMEQTNL